MGCECTTTGLTRTLSLLEIQIAVEKLEKCCEELKDLTKENVEKIDNNIASITLLDDNQIVDIVLIDDVWNLKKKNGDVIPFRKVNKDTQNNILEEED